MACVDVQTSDWSEEKGKPLKYCMACVNCPFCNLSMDYLQLNKQPSSTSKGRLVRTVLHDSPVSDVVSPGQLEENGSLVDFHLGDCSYEDGRESESAYDVGRSGYSYRAKSSTVESSANSSAYSEESGFCSEGTFNLQCGETSVWWTGDTSSNPSDIPSPIPASPESRVTSPAYVDYNVDVYRHRKEIEDKTHFTDFLKNQREITPGIRGVLVSWLSKVHKEFQLSLDTLFLTVNIVDRLLKVKPVSRECFQLVGATAMLIAGKHEEVSPPEIQDLLWVCGDTYSREQMRELEKIILKAINFNLFVPTGSFFLEYFSSSEMSSRPKDTDRLRNARRQAKYFLELALQDYELCQFPPSMLALSAWKAAVRDCVSEYESYPPWEADFDAPSFEECYHEFTVFMARLTQSFPEANVLRELHAYDDVDDSDSD